MRYKASLNEKHSIMLNGYRKTSISLESQFWDSLKEIAGLTEQTLIELVTTIDEKRTNGSLSSAVRLYVLDYYQKGVEA